MNDETLCIGAVVVAVLMIGGLALLTWLDDRDSDDNNEVEILLVQEGDEVSVDYTGRFLGSNEELGAIFDTSISDDASNDSIPKSLGFMEKPAYDDLTFSVGSGQMIPGFEKGVLGMSVGSVKYIRVSPENGYGATEPDLVLDIQTKQSIPVSEVLEMDDFRGQYPLVDVETQDSFIHPFWGWEVLILDHDPASVTIFQQPAYLEDYGNFPWNVTVIDVSTSRNQIILSHNIDEIDPTVPISFLDIAIFDHEWSNSAREVTGGQEPDFGYITSVGGIITIDFNREVVGKDLVFKVIINDIKRGSE